MKKTFLLLLIALTCLCLSGISHAQEEEPAPGFNACMDNAQTTVDMAECTNSGIEHWNAVLKESYAQAQECPFEDEARCAEYQASLVKSMTAWEAHRDATATYLAGASGGTMDILNSVMFVLETTRAQALLLQQ